MSSVAELEQQILALPAEEFLHVRDVVYERERALLGEDEFEDDPWLEAELLKAVDGPWLPMNDEFFDSIRRSVREHA